MSIREGDRYGRWTVTGPRIDGTRKYPCRCACGTERAVDGPALRTGGSQSCGCLSREVTARQARARTKHQVNPGDGFGRLTVLAVQTDASRRVALCRCACGDQRSYLVSNLLSGASQSCGCRKREMSTALGKKNRQHGLSGHPLYKTWQLMVGRCTHETSPDWRYYGGRGIRVHGPWLDPARFIADIEAELGPKPYGYTIDRIDNDGHYEPGNVRWATRADQNRNKRPPGSG